jgi:raffinose/stachyose/melibiose transport system permease protein
MGNKYTGKLFTMEVFAILLGLVFLIPFYYVVSNSLKPFSEILTNTSALPKVLQFQNYMNAFQQMNYVKVFTNSLIITVASNQQKMKSKFP